MYTDRKPGKYESPADAASWLEIPHNAVKYILFQRTAYLRHPRYRLLNALLRIVPGLTFERIVRLESVVYSRAVRNAYARDLSVEFERLKPFLPPSVNSVLDIGAGMGGIDVFLSRHFKHGVQLYLLDKTQVAEAIYYQFKTRGAFYNSLAIARQILLRNGIPDQNIHLRNASDDFTIEDVPKCDLVMSLLSWGFHYPVSSYLDAVTDCMKPGGALILDVRRGTSGLHELTQRFGQGEVIAESKKFARMKFIQPPG